MQGVPKKFQVLNQKPKIYSEWTEWAEWSGCPVTCGGNSMNGRQRSRSCEGGNEGDPGCQGASEETEVCNAQACPGRPLRNIA